MLTFNNAQVIPENNMRPGRFSGVVMSYVRNGSMTRFTVRNVLKGTGPVERSFLLFSPFITGITIHRTIKVRRKKLTYLRKRKDAHSTFQV
jgi:large subunit ribosomal protein L19